MLHALFLSTTMLVRTRDVRMTRVLLVSLRRGIQGVKGSD